MSSKSQVKYREPPEVIVNHKDGKKYIRGRLLGKGGFAKCYELTDKITGEKFAGKAVAKAALVKTSQKEKMQQEILIHRGLNDENVVKFHGYFEDPNFIYIILELCTKRSLLELHKRRRYITEPEARYFMRQIIAGCQYLHTNKVVHRDLKLANLLLNENLVVKIGDFGLASIISADGEKKRTLCGTPNYIAPEILLKGGHSFEVDCWSLGCILYTLIVGTPPFETDRLEDTYSRIKHNEYRIPTRVSTYAAKLIRGLLHPDPKSRPRMPDLLKDDFLMGFTPVCLPLTVLSDKPRFDGIADEQGRRILSDINPLEDHPITSGGALQKLTEECVRRNSPDCRLRDLKDQSAPVLKDSEDKQLAESEDPACIPIYWVSKWVDYSDKYGLGYDLCDNSSGVVFNDMTHLISAANNDNLQYIDQDGNEEFHLKDKHPESMRKKVQLLDYFKGYMHENLLKAGENVARRDGDDMARLPYLRRWFRTRTAIVLHLSNGTLQLNFFEDHVKIILCPLMNAITQMHNDSFTTYRFDLLEQNGIMRDMLSRIDYASAMIDRLRTLPSGQFGGTVDTGAQKEDTAPAPPVAAKHRH